MPSRHCAVAFLILATAAAVLVLFPGCNKKTEEAVVPADVGPALQRERSAKVQPPVVRFRDITAQAGVHFHHTNGAFGQKLLP
jgi:hypothetical protein